MIALVCCFIISIKTKTEAKEATDKFVPTPLGHSAYSVGSAFQTVEVWMRMVSIGSYET